MFDHVTVQVADVSVSRRFYTALLAPLGIRPGHEDGAAVGYFSDSEAGGFWLGPAHGAEARELHAPSLHGRERSSGSSTLLV